MNPDSQEGLDNSVLNTYLILKLESLTFKTKAKKIGGSIFT